MSLPLPPIVSPQWVDVPYLETSDRVLGGLTGAANASTRALYERTEVLKRTNGAVGGGSDQTFIQNGNTITTSYTVPAGYNAGTFGPVTVLPGAVITVPSGSVWTIV